VDGLADLVLRGLQREAVRVDEVLVRLRSDGEGARGAARAGEALGDDAGLEVCVEALREDRDTEVIRVLY
jgi:hypothetical protein